MFNYDDGQSLTVNSDKAAPAHGQSLSIEQLTNFQDALAQAVAPAGGQMNETDQLQAALPMVLRETVTVMPFASAATVALYKSGKTKTVAGTSAAASATDAAQQLGRQGPSLQALTEQRVCVSDDVRTDGRWPQLSLTAGEATLRSAISVPFNEGNAGRGVLTIYSEQVAAWTADAAEHGAMRLMLGMATMAIGSLYHQQQIVNLRRALDSNREIGAAVGVLMSQHRCTYEAAFEKLVHTSQNSHLKLRAVADEVLMTGALPDQIMAYDRAGSSTAHPAHDASLIVPIRPDMP